MSYRNYFISNIESYFGRQGHEVYLKNNLLITDIFSLNRFQMYFSPSMENKFNGSISLYFKNSLIFKIGKNKYLDILLMLFHIDKLI